MAEHPPVDDDVQSPVELAVAEGVEPVPGDLAGGCFQRADPGQGNEGGLGAGRGGTRRLPYGPMGWTVLLLHLFWDSWIHERDVLLARGAEHPHSRRRDWLCGRIRSVHLRSGRGGVRRPGAGEGEAWRRRRRLFDPDSRGGVTLTVSRQQTPGPCAAEVAAALPGRAHPAAVLGGLPASARAVCRTSPTSSTPVQQSSPKNPAKQ